MGQWLQELEGESPIDGFQEGVVKPRFVPIHNRYKFVPQVIEKTFKIDRDALIEASDANAILLMIVKAARDELRYNVIYRHEEIETNQIVFVFQKRNY